MPYVPPHLRGSTSATASAAPPSNGVRRSDKPSGGDGWGDDRGSSFSGRRDAGRGYDDRPSARNGGAAALPDAKPKPRGTEAVFAPWKPSERVEAMTPEQIKDARQRLNITVEMEGTATMTAPIESFDDMNLHADILMDIRHREYSMPTPIQAQGLPAALGGNDILGCAETGSGKTASFAIPMVQHVINQPPLRRGDGPIGLVLAPTRELAQQIDREVKAFSKTPKGVKSAIVVGGVNMMEQRSDLRTGVEIVVATPGRFIDHLQQGNTYLNRVSFIVLDEADRMLDMGFEPQIREVMQNLPLKHQTLLFSATMPEEIEGLAKEYLSKPVLIKVGQVSTPTANVTQHLQKTTDTNKIDDVAGIILEETAAAQGNQMELPLTIVFVERKARCDEVAEALRADEVKAAALHGGLSQGEREVALRDFTQGHIRVLVATDVASRGLDIKGIAHVINLDLPRTFEDYVHRIGRTGRAGATGRATSLYTDRDSFVVSQIKRAMQELESGNAFAFATGKAARQKEREMAQEFKQRVKLGPSGMMETASGAAVKVDNKYLFMTTTDSVKTGAADDAWDD